MEGNVYTDLLREEFQLQSNALLTIKRRPDSFIAEQTRNFSVDEVVCVSKIGFIIALVITALLALVAIAIAVSCWLMADKRKPQEQEPLPHPSTFPNPLFIEEIPELIAELD